MIILTVESTGGGNQVKIKISVMKVILLKKVEKLGKAGEVKEVADGFARNYLLPKNLASPATQKAIKKVEEHLKEEVKKNEEELKENQVKASKIRENELTIKEKAKEGKLFGSVAKKDIAKALGKKGIEIKESNIELKEPVREIGEYDIKIQLEHGIESELKLIVEEEK